MVVAETQWLCSKQSSVRWLVEWDVAAFVDEEASEGEEDVVVDQVSQPMVAMVATMAIQDRAGVSSTELTI